MVNVTVKILVDSVIRGVTWSVVFLVFSVSGWGEERSEGLPDPVSYYEHVRPIFQAKCHGCHQPAKSKGDYVLTDVARMIAGGEGGEPVVVAHRPEESFLIDLVTLQEGADRPEMPEEDEPLTSYELALVTKWIEQGARDDTPENARQRFDADHPPQYAVAPVLTSLDYSPDGELIAVAGFHEVLLHKADGSGLVARLIGLSERIETARFSPDGKWLAVAGGLPGRMGEIQIWDVEKASLKFSKPVGYDTAYGASWSPDGKYVAYGLPDHTLRAIEVSSGDEVFFMGSHTDWVLDTAWSVEGDHLVSVSRDMSAKLTEVETERFIDNITSITPGALKGGINAIDNHPHWDHVLMGGSDGVPQIYRMHRETERKIGDNANLIRKYPPMKGRIWSVAFAPDGKTFAAVSSLNGKGQINLYASDYDATITPELKKLFETARRNPDGSKNIEPEIESFHTRGANLLHSTDVDSPVFSVAFAPDAKSYVAGTSDGRILIFDAASGKLGKTFIPVEVTDSDMLAKAEPKRPENPVNLKKGQAKVMEERPEEVERLTRLSVSPSAISLEGPNAYNQLLVTGTLESGEVVDLTRLVRWEVTRPIAEVEDRGIIRPLSGGRTAVTAHFLGLRDTASVEVKELKDGYEPDFVVDVNPILSRLGCNAGTCHGSQDGKNGFKLSLRGYDAFNDVRAFSDDHAARRVNFASPDDSLMLLKATAAVPHEGGMVTDIGSDYYETIRRWIAHGATMKEGSEKVSRIELEPQNPVIERIRANWQMRVIAHYPDGSQRDVTREAIIESGNTEVAVHDDFGLITTIRRGEAPILARYEGAYAATTLTVMGDRTGFAWKEPETWNRIDELVAAKWLRMKILPSELTRDEEFLRRVHLDLTGLPPKTETLISFLKDDRPSRQKRTEMIDRLIGSPEFVDHWANKWADMLQVNSKFLGKEGSELFRDWIRGQMEENVPYDEFVYSILTAEGSNKKNPPASYYKILRTPEELMENTTHLFLATRFNCNKCHDHPFERWNVDNYYQMAAFFSQVDLKRDKYHAPKATIGGTAVENAKPLYEIVWDRNEGEVTNILTGDVAQPAFPYPATAKELTSGGEADIAPSEPTRRERLAAWITAEDNQYFAKSYANRIWGYLTGTGIIEPIDDIRASNPPTNPELLDYLTDYFVDSGFNVRELMREICNSRTYQLSIRAHPYNEDDAINYSHGKARRLPAEVLFDSVYAVTGAQPHFPGAKPGMRAAQLADAQVDTKGGFLANLGRPPRESACECDRQNDVQLGAVMSLLSGASVAEAVGDPDNGIAELVTRESDDRSMIEKLYLRVLNRFPTQDEIDLVKDNWSLIERDHENLIARLAEMESDWVWRKAELETERFRAIARARADIKAYEPEFKAKKEATEKERKKRIAAAKKALWEFEWDELPSLQEAGIQAITLDRFWTLWSPQYPEEAEGDGKVDLIVNNDGSLLGSGELGNSVVYKMTFPVGATTISGFMLEALTDDILPGFGPGFNETGNFVVSEVEFSYSDSAATDPEDRIEVPLSEVAADYTEDGFSVEKIINGNPDRNDKAWAVGGQERRPHWARVKLEEPLSFDEKGGKVHVSVICRYSNGDYPLGKFRIYFTDAEDPLNLGLPEPIAAILSKAPSVREPEENAALYTWFKHRHPEYLSKRFDWVKANRPLPKDEKMESLKAALAKAERPVPKDPALVQLRSDVQYSTEQAANRRLTAAQDLAWALINNSAFLFNY